MTTEAPPSQAAPPEAAAEAVPRGEVLADIRQLRRVYPLASGEVVALEGADLQIHRGDFLALMGPSGSGKSTLLHLMAGVDRPTSGSCHIQGTDVARLSESELARWRNQTIGFVFQSFNLIPVLTAAENVEMPLLLTGLSGAERRRQVALALELVGLSSRADHRPRQLSGGQQQRVAIARAIATDPTLLLADEPTGNLDAQSAQEVLDIFRVLNREMHKTIVIVTHDPHAASSARETRWLEKGHLLPPGRKPEFW